MFTSFFLFKQASSLTCDAILNMSEAVSTISNTDLSTLSDIQNCFTTIGSLAWSSSQLVVLASLTKVNNYHNYLSVRQYFILH